MKCWEMSKGVAQGGHGQVSKQKRQNCGKWWPQERKAKGWDKDHGVWRNCQHVARRVLERGRSQEKQCHKKRGALQKDNAHEMKKEKA